MLREDDLIPVRWPIEPRPLHRSSEGPGRRTRRCSATVPVHFRARLELSPVDELCSAVAEDLLDGVLGQAKIPGDLPDRLPESVVRTVSCLWLPRSMSSWWSLVPRLVTRGWRRSQGWVNFRRRSLQSRAVTREPLFSHSGRFHEERDSGATPKSLLLLAWCRRGDSNPHGFPHHPLKMACLPSSTTSAREEKPY